MIEAALAAVSERAPATMIARVVRAYRNLTKRLSVVHKKIRDPCGKSHMRPLDSLFVCD